MIYPLQLFNGHPVIRTKTEIILVDTGAQATLNSTGQLEFEGTVHRCSTQLGTSVADISGLLGMDITTLLGVDVLEKYQVLFDYSNQQIEFSQTPKVFEGHAIALDRVMGIPVIPLTIGGAQHRFFLDTGAQYSYASGHSINAFPPAGQAEDFYPGIGRFQINCHTADLMIGTDQFTARCGIPPALVQRLLAMGDCQGIIGADLFNQFKIQLDLTGRQMKYRRNE